MPIPILRTHTKTPKVEKTKGQVTITVPEGPGAGTMKSMGAATRGGKFAGTF